MNEMNIKENENITDIMVLLGLEHKMSTQLTQVEEFLKYYSELLENVEKKLNKFGYRLIRFFHLKSLCEKKIIPCVTNRAKYELKIKKFEKEKRDIIDMLNFIRGKVLYLSDVNISKLGIIKE